MKIRLILITLTCALVSLPSVQAQAPATAPKRDFNTPIGDAMDKIRTANNGLAAQLADSSKNADSLARLATIKAQAAEAKKHEPVRAAEADDKAKFLTDFRSHMDNFIAQIDKVEAALKAGNNAEATNLFNEAANTQKAGHKSYKKGKAGGGKKG